MPKGIVRSKKQQEQADLALARKLKPKLRRFLIDTQTQNAQRAAQEEAAARREMAAGTEVMARAMALSIVAWQERRYWKLYPPYMTARWTTTLAWSRAHELDRLADVAGFATYLIRMNRYYKAHLNDKDYLPNPLDEANLLFYWRKCQADLAIQHGIDQKLVDKGNAGLGFVGKKEEAE